MRKGVLRIRRKYGRKIFWKVGKWRCARAHAARAGADLRARRGLRFAQTPAPTARGYVVESVRRQGLA